MSLASLPITGSSDFENTVRTALNSWKTEIERLDTAKSDTSHTHGTGDTVYSIAASLNALGSGATSGATGVARDTLLSYRWNGSAWVSEGGIARPYTKSQHFTEIGLTATGSTFSWDMELAQCAFASLSSLSMGMATPTNMAAGKSGVIRFIGINANGNAIGTWASEYELHNDETISFSSASLGNTDIGYYCDGVSVHIWPVYKEA